MSRSLRSTQLCSVPLAVLEHTGLKHGQTLGMLELLRLELAHVAGIVVLGSKTSDVARIGTALDRLQTSFSLHTDDGRSLSGMDYEEEMST